jgi:hypothetical protein
MTVPRLKRTRTTPGGTPQLASFVKSAGRGLPLLMPPPAGRVHPCAPARAAAPSRVHIDILPLSMVAVPGPEAGTAAITATLR